MSFALLSCDKEEPKEEPVQKPLKLIVSSDEMVADGEDKVTFSILIGEKEIGEKEGKVWLKNMDTTPSLLSGFYFTTKVAGTYTFYARVGKQVSNNVVVTAHAQPEEKPVPNPTPNPTPPEPNPKPDPTPPAPAPNPAPEPAPPTPEPNPAPEPAPPMPEPNPAPEPAPPTPAPNPEPAPTPKGKSIVFAEGVTQHSGWYDVNKKGRGETHGDINMCWAASAANIIQWWQDRYVALGHTLPEGAISGKGETYELALMDLFHKEWDNRYGGQVHHAVTWYFEGRNILKEASEESSAQPLPNKTGGYYKQIWQELLPHLYHDYSYIVIPNVLEYKNLISREYLNYSEWGNGSNLEGEERLRHFSSLVVTFMERGMISLTISRSPDFRTLHHATTLWGYEIDNESGLLTRVWITDSDNMEREPKKPILHEYTVSLDEQHGSIKFSGKPYGACYAVSLYPVSGYKVAPWK